jgi:nitrate/nitrite transporter NarK
VIGLALAAGFVVQGNFSNLTAGSLAVAPPAHVGATMGLYSCIGFGGGFLVTVGFGAALDQFGGTSNLIAWALSFASCGLVCLAGSAAIMFLSRDIGRVPPETKRIKNQTS